jgi:hypothetical protein
VRESQYSKAIEARGEHKGAVAQAQAYVIKSLQTKLQSSAPEPLRLAIEGTNDLKTLDRWFKALFAVKSWDELLQLMKQP